MPRGRKGSPQESVDSILLAISRREDIDTDTMSHYLDRLDEEWAEGAREKVLHLLRSNDALAQAAALRILAELATDFDLESLEDFVTDPTVSDLAKLSLSPILKELGSDMVDDGIIEYLNDPAGAIRQMQMRLLELVGQNEMGIETILEDVVSMPVERRFAFINWLGNSNDPRAANLLIPLLENQTGKIVQAVIEALEQLGPIALNLTIPALNHTIATTSNREVKQMARTTLGRLTMQAMLGSEDTAMMEERQQQLPSYQARVSSIDGTGTQLIMLSWLRPDGLIKGVNILFQDKKGIKDCYGVDEMDVKQWESLVGDLDDQGFSSFLVPFEYARALIMNARALNRRSRTKLPIAYSIWRPLTEAGLRSKNARASLPAITIDPSPLNDQAKELALKGDMLFQLKEFTSWLYEPIDRVEPYIMQYWSKQNGLDANPRSGRKGHAKVQAQQELLEQLVNKALPNLIDDKWRTIYVSRLLRQAALFQQVGRKEEVSLMRAIAAVLHTDSQIPAQEQAFVRAMIRISIEQGPLRLMVESLRSGSLNAFPVDFFQQE
jgi:HEAT repeats